MRQFIEWAWGEPFGEIVDFKSYWPAFDKCGCNDWREWGIAWPVILVERNGSRKTTTPIWNWIWLRNRVGFACEDNDSPGAM